MTQKRSILELGHEVCGIAERHAIAIPNGAEPAEIITAIHDAIYERGRTFRDDLRRLAKIRRELDGIPTAGEAHETAGEGNGLDDISQATQQLTPPDRSMS